MFQDNQMIPKPIDFVVIKAEAKMKSVFEVVNVKLCGQ